MRNVRRALRKLVQNPRLHGPKLRKIALQPLCGLFQNTSFFLQGQMDISPRSRWYNEFALETGGFFLRNDPVQRQICNLDSHDNTRRDMLILLLRTIIERKIDGAFAELGVYRGLTAKLLHYYAPERELHLFDTFEGFTGRSTQPERERTGFVVDSSMFSDTSLEGVKRYIRQKNENVTYHPGYFPATIPPALRSSSFAFVHLDADLYDPIFAGLAFFYPRMSRSGIIVVHDYNGWIGARRAVDTFFEDKKDEIPIPMPDKSGSALIVKH